MSDNAPDQTTTSRDLQGRRLDELPDLLTIKELSVFTGIPVSTLYDWNSRDLGPEPKKLGKHLRYPKGAVAEWLNTLDRRGSAA